jgi:membrane-associated phospholipid phosphatase
MLLALEKLWRFASRHVWSLSLAASSALMFVQLARELAGEELAPFDSSVSGWLRAQRGCCDAPMWTLTWLGQFDRLATLTVLAVVLLVALKRRREAIYVATCAVGSCILCAFLKSFFQRERPDVAFKYMIAMPSSFSFPSGHAMGSMGVLGALVVVVFAVRAPRVARVVASLLGAATVFGVAISRVYFGVHYPSDVIGGQLAGAAWVAAVTGWFYPRLLPAESSSTTAAEEEQSPGPIT